VGWSYRRGAPIEPLPHQLRGMGRCKLPGGPGQYPGCSRVSEHYTPGGWPLCVTKLTRKGRNCNELHVEAAPTSRQSTAQITRFKSLNCNLYVHDIRFYILLISYVTLRPYFWPFDLVSAVTYICSNSVTNFSEIEQSAEHIIHGPDRGTEKSYETT